MKMDKRKWHLYLLIVLVIVPSLLVAMRPVSTYQAACGEWQVVNSREDIIKVEPMLVEDNEDCKATFLITNNTGLYTSASILGANKKIELARGNSYELIKNSENVAFHYSYLFEGKNDIKLDWFSYGFDSNYEPGIFLIPDFPLAVTVTPNESQHQSALWLNTEKGFGSFGLDLTIVLLDALVDFADFTCVAPETEEFIMALVIYNKNKAWLDQVNSRELRENPDLIAKFEVLLEEMKNLYLNWSVDTGIECMSEKVLSLTDETEKRLLLGKVDLWLISYLSYYYWDVQAGYPFIYITYTPPVDDTGHFSYFSYLLDGEIHLVRPSSDSENILSNPISGYVNYDFSPDGRYLIALREGNKEEGYGYELNLINRLTNEIISNTHTSGFSNYHEYEMPIKWSPDSALFFYNKLLVSNRGNALKEILPDEYIDYTDISWLSNSQSIFYINEQENFQGLELFRYNVLFGLVENLGVFPTDGFGYCAHLYDPVTEWIAALGGCVEGQATLAMLHPNGEIRILNQGNHVVFRGLFTGEWSPKGGLFVYTVGRPYARASIKIYDAINGVEIKLPNLEGSNPAWSPDGEKIAFTTPKGGLEIYDLITGKSQEVLGSAPNKVLSEEFTFGGGKGELLASWQMIPSWSPNGRFVILPYPDSIERWDGGNPNKESDAGFYIIDTVTGESYWFDKGIRPQWIP